MINLSKACAVVFIVFTAMFCSSAAIAGDDAFLRWQADDAKNRLRDREGALLSAEVELKRDIWQLDQDISAAVRKRANKSQDLQIIQREILAVKMQLL